MHDSREWNTIGITYIYKKRGIPEQPYKILGLSFYQWLLVGGWTVHEGSLHEYSNLFGLFLLEKEVIF